MERDKNLEALTTIVNALKTLEKDAQTRTLQAVITYLDISMPSSSLFPVINTSDKKPIDNNSDSNKISFSDNRSISPKDFLRDKAPVTDIERIVCLGYYLTHYRDMPHFKTLDLSTLNIEAAQPKFSNPAAATDNATRAGLLVQSIKGAKQISAAGEIFVQALPDRDLAKTKVANIRTKRRNKKPVSKNHKKNKL